MTASPKDIPPQLFPASVLETDAPDTANPWMVARTKTRQEKALAWALQAKNIHYFLPLTKRPQKCQDRMRTSVVPLFNGYLFFQASPSTRSDILQTGRVAQILPVLDQHRLRQQLSSLATACTLSVDMELVDFMLPGQQVRIISGPCAGLVGTVHKVRSTRKLVLYVDAIGQGVAITIATNQVQPI